MVKGKIQAFIDGLIMYDYILFGAVFTLFILFIILGIVLRKKIALAVFLILLAFIVLLAGPTIGRMEMHKSLFKNTTTLTSEKRLQFTDAIVVKGIISNDSRFNFERCLISVNVHPVSENALKNHLFQFKIIKKMSIIEEDIAKGESRVFKIIVDPFTYSKDYNISLGARCR
jgi:uncharacterized SAM-binding protein YcdF (DUF218 family)